MLFTCTCKSDSFDGSEPDTCKLPEFAISAPARFRIFVYGMPVKKNWEADWELPKGPDAAACSVFSPDLSGAG